MLNVFSYCTFDGIFVDRQSIRISVPLRIRNEDGQANGFDVCKSLDIDDKRDVAGF